MAWSWAINQRVSVYIQLSVCALSTYAACCQHSLVPGLVVLCVLAMLQFLSLLWSISRPPPACRHPTETQNDLKIHPDFPNRRKQGCLWQYLEDI